ncbi:50S ribosomal protein L23 [Putridiphycobacter roseus]|uniref:Large ribosomal subunit protein uL23 n=1 Tax=Putridiphycobacter roseus TaxID=2219161 RepID=A0A2W1N5I7_9FLAO|nr:50S ribosomal protein L23 [Putridiphycobacter roseus]PZE18391.1 50S ribosomal protein L23 [Putridiphycobacter roseus]
MSAIIKRPLLTEKATNDSENNNRFAFEVDHRANKLQIKAAIEELYGVSIENVRTMRYGGGKAKRKYTARGIAEQRNSIWKKAIVQVAEGETIDLYDNI